jgi:hypothetical protein
MHDEAPDMTHAVLAPAPHGADQQVVDPCPEDCVGSKIVEQAIECLRQGRDVWFAVELGFLAEAQPLQRKQLGRALRLGGTKADCG